MKILYFLTLLITRVTIGMCTLKVPEKNKEKNPKPRLIQHVTGNDCHLFGHRNWSAGRYLQLHVDICRNVM